MSAQRSMWAGEDLWLATFDANPASQELVTESCATNTFTVMQKFMLDKGLINNTMNEQEMLDFINKESSMNETGQQLQLSCKKKTEQLKQKKTTTGRESISSSSEVTIYKRAVQQLDPNLSSQIEDLLNKSRRRWSTQFQRERVILFHQRTMTMLILVMTHWIS